jgi:hypothetical protein
VTEETNETQEMTALILRDFELVAPKEAMTEADMIDYLSDAIAYMLENKTDFLFSLLYRLDVAESKINFALSLHCSDPANIALAKLVWERQKQRIATKRAFREHNPTNWDWDLE